MADDTAQHSGKTSDVIAYDRDETIIGVRALVMEIIRFAAPVSSNPRRATLDKIDVAAAMLGLTSDRVKRYWYNQVGRVEAHEAYQIVTNVQRARLRRANELEQQLSAINADMAKTDARFCAHLPDTAPARHDLGDEPPSGQTGASAPPHAGDDGGFGCLGIPQ